MHLSDDFLKDKILSKPGVDFVRAYTVIIDNNSAHLSMILSPINSPKLSKINDPKQVSRKVKLSR